MIILPPLPYAKNALEPYISSKTMDFHYDKHHAGYVNNLNKFIENTDFNGMILTDIMKKTAQNISKDGNIGNIDIFRNAMQTWNHTFFWNSLFPKSDSEQQVIPVELMQKINSDFGDLQKFKELFAKAALTQFGSGWAWLVFNRDAHKLEIIKTSNEESPQIHDKYVPLLTLDVWEHAYYLDYQNQRASYIKSIVDNILNWEFAYNNFLMI